MNIRDIHSAIIQGSFTNSELDSVIEAVKFARHVLIRKNKRGIQVGSTVHWTSSRMGSPASGQVVKIGQKYLTVETPQGMWRVPANMVEKMSEIA